MKRATRILAALLCVLLLLPTVVFAEAQPSLEKQIAQSAEGMSALGGKKGELLKDRELFPAGDSVCDWLAIAMALSGTSALRFLSLLFFCRRCTFSAQFGQYLARLDLASKPAPHSAQRFSCAPHFSESIFCARDFSFHLPQAPRGSRCASHPASCSAVRPTHRPSGHRMRFRRTSQ